MSDGMARRSVLATGGSVVAAAVASACCWLPLVLIVVGGSAAGVATFFEAARPWFLGASVVLLGLGFYLNYFRHGKCDEGAACASPSRTLQRTSRIMLWVAAIGVAAFAFFPNYVGSFVGGTSTRVDAANNEARVDLTVDGMTCGGCAVTVEQALLRVPGVVTAHVNYEESHAVITLDPDAPASSDALIAAVDKTGYTASLKP